MSAETSGNVSFSRDVVRAPVVDVGVRMGMDGSDKKETWAFSNVKLSDR
jgi:hypothetical protein